MAFSRFYVLAVLGVLSGCAGTGLETRYENAQEIAARSRLSRIDITSAPFVLASWQKMSAPGKPVNVYIEGDGLAWLSRSMPSNDPTPKTPLALDLAARDPAENVVYLARPCQFTQGKPGNACERAYWTGKRYAPEVIASFDGALAQIAQQSGNGGFHLIGFSGGANVAGLLAQRRSDILSLRSVAGNLDNDFFNQMHEVSAMPESLNMANKAEMLANLPQRHFIGGKDTFVPKPVFESYRAKIGDVRCVNVTHVPEAEHLKGWGERWGALLKLPVACGELSP